MPLEEHVRRQSNIAALYSSRWEPRHFDGVDHGFGHAPNQQLEPGLICQSVEQSLGGVLKQHCSLLMQRLASLFVLRDFVAIRMGHGDEYPFKSMGHRAVDLTVFFIKPGYVDVELC